MTTDKDVHSLHQFAACYVHRLLETIARSLPLPGSILDPRIIRLVEQQRVV